MIEKNLTVSIAVHNPDIPMFSRMLVSLKTFTPELKQVIIVDNASENKDWQRVAIEIFDSGPEEDRVEFDHVPRENNEGFGSAHNNALKMATGEYFAVLNDDIRFFAPWAGKMIEALQDPEVAQVGPTTNVCNCWNDLGQGFGDPTVDQPEYCEGSLFMMRTDLAKSFGLFDEAFHFAYHEDGDLSLRFRKAGYKLRHVPVKWIHYRAVTSSKNPVDIQGYVIKNKYTFESRHSAYLLKKKFGPYIVVRRTGSIGDVFLTTPVIKALKKKYPDSVVCLLTACPQAVENNPDIDFISDQTMTPMPCNIFIDLDSAYERNFTVNIVDAYADIAEVELESRVGTPAILQEHMDKIDKVFLRKPNETYVALDISESWEGKRWPYENYRELNRLLQGEPGVKTVGIGIIGGYQRSRWIPFDFDFVNQLDIAPTHALLRQVDVLITNEGLTVHLAQSLQKPTVALYGCTLPEYCNDISLPSLYPVLTPAACGGCRHRKFAGNKIECPRNSECMRMIEPSKVFAEYRKINRKDK